MGSNGRTNSSPVSLREGCVYLDGTLIADTCKFSLKFVPDVWEGKSLGDKGTNRRWLGYTIKGTIEQWKTTKAYRKKIEEYLKTGATPEFTMQGISNDKNSDYYDENGEEVLTAVGCVMTGEIPLIELDTDGEVVKESIEFGAKDLV